MRQDRNRQFKHTVKSIRVTLCDGTELRIQRRANGEFNLTVRGDSSHIFTPLKANGVPMIEAASGGSSIYAVKSVLLAIAMFL